VHLAYPVTVAALLFAVGVYGVLARRNAVCVLMSVELMLNAANLLLVAFDAWFRDGLHAGQVFALFVVAVAAAEVGVGLAIVLAVFRSWGSVSVDDRRDLNEVPGSVDKSAAAGAPVDTEWKVSDEAGAIRP
jgi:NADH-quinone oxidoreductase subunit K